MDQEEVQRHGCTGKKRYGSKAAAEAAADRYRRPSDVRFGGYKCLYCPFWHVGHRRNRRQKKRG